MYNKKTLTFTFHYYWGPFYQGACVLGELLYGGLLCCSEKPVNDQSYGILDHYGITIQYK